MTRAAEVEAGASTDLLVAEKVMGFDPKETDPAKWPWWDPNELSYGRRKAVPGPYTTDDVAAGQVARRMRENWFSYKAWEPALVGSPEIYSVVSFVCGAGPCPKHGTTVHNHHGSYRVQAPTLALAICRSALVALNVVEEDAEF